MLQFTLMVIVLSILFYLTTQQDTTCIYPGQCQPPSSSGQYSRVLNVIPRQQWVTEGGFCGATTVQTIAQNFGAYISVDIIRKNSIYGGGGSGDNTTGYELLPLNINATLSNLSIEYEEWDHDNEPQPQSGNHLKWMKYHLSQGAGILSFVMCQGDSHNAYGLGAFDHIEPIFGVYSNNPLPTTLNESEIFDDDWLVHGSNYAPDGNANKGYFRIMNNFTDDTNFSTNCKDAQPGQYFNEMFPCIDVNENWGTAITGLSDPLGITKPLVLYVSSYAEPNIRIGESPIDMYATIVITELTPTKVYNVYRYDSDPNGGITTNYPKDGNFYISNFTTEMNFTAESTSYRYVDPNVINSDSAVYYACFEEPGNLLKDIYVTE